MREIDLALYICTFEAIFINLHWALFNTLPYHRVQPKQSTDGNVVI